MIIIRRAFVRRYLAALTAPACLVSLGAARRRRPSLPATAQLRPAQEQPADDEWQPLFNGKNLDGWTPKIKGFSAGEDPRNTFRVEDGLLKVSYDQYQAFDNQFGHLFYKDKYSHYRLRIEYRFVGEQCPGGPGWALRNSGVMLHGQAVETMRKDQEFPVSIEVQFLGANDEPRRPTANLCTPGTHVVMNGKLWTQHCTDSQSPTFRGDEWVTVEVEVRGSRLIRHIVGEQVVLEYTEPQLDGDDDDARRLINNANIMLHEGSISLQAESHPIHFRRVELMPLQAEDD